MFIFLSGWVSGAGVLPEAGSSAAIPGHMPEGKQPGASGAACRRCPLVRQIPVSTEHQTWMSSVHLPVHLLHQTCLFNRQRHCFMFRTLHSSLKLMWTCVLTRRTTKKWITNRPLLHFSTRMCCYSQWYHGHPMFEHGLPYADLWHWHVISTCNLSVLDGWSVIQPSPRTWQKKGNTKKGLLMM